MVYVTCNNGNIETFLTWKDAERFVKENGLDMEEDVCEMDC